MATRSNPLRPPGSILGRGNQPSSWTTSDWPILFVLLLIATSVRLVFFNGFFGSDDITYLGRSLEISQGIWSSANYNGALRYGYNIPAAFFIYLFGLNTFTANMWTLLCSLGEVALVYFFAARFIGRRAAVFAALVLACIPLHIALGTRIHADSVFAFFLTLAFVLFYLAEQSNSRRFYFATGLTLGMIFWVKELGVITFLAFATYPILVRRLNKEWVWVIVGGLVMLAGHLILMQIIAGDPLHLIKTVTGQVQTSFAQGGGGEDSAVYYFKYLFLDIKHTWLAPFLAVAAIAGLLFHWKNHTRSNAYTYVAWWLIALLIVLSFTPVSFNPMRLAMKQSNYLNLFLAPIALLGGLFLAKLPNRIYAHLLAVATLTGGILLGAMEQQSYRLFTANSRAATAFMQAHPSDWMLGTVNNANMARIVSIIEFDSALAGRFGYLSSNFETNRIKAPMVGRSPFGFVVIDEETHNWGNTQIKLEAAPSCWQPVTTLEPALDGMGQRLLSTALTLIKRLPDTIGEKLETKLHVYSRPQPATIYRVEISNLWCSRADSLTPDSELDSMAVVTILTAMEEHFGFIVDDDEISADTFATLGTLTAFVEQKLSA